MVLNRCHRYLMACKTVLIFAQLFVAMSCSDDVAMPKKSECQFIDCNMVVIVPMASRNSVKIDSMASWVQDIFLEIGQDKEYNVRLNIEWHDEDVENLDSLASVICGKNDVDMVIGPLNSRNVACFAPVMRNCDIPMISPLCTSEQLIGEYAHDGFFWTFSASDVMQCKGLLKLAKQMDNYSVSFLNVDDEYGKTFSEWGVPLAENIDIFVDTVVTFNSSNIEEKVHEVAAVGSSVVICASSNNGSDDIERLLAAIREDSLNVIFSDAMYNETFIMSYARLLEGYEGLAPCADPKSGFDLYFRKKYGKEPTWEAFLYDAFFYTMAAKLDHVVSGSSSVKESLCRIISSGSGNMAFSWDFANARAYLTNLSQGCYAPYYGAVGHLIFGNDNYVMSVDNVYAHWAAYDGRFVTLGYLRPDDGGDDDPISDDPPYEEPADDDLIADDPSYDEY